MARMEKDLGVWPERVAVGHFKTEHRHVHVALQRVAKGGERDPFATRLREGWVTFNCRGSLYPAARPSLRIERFRSRTERNSGKSCHVSRSHHPARRGARFGGPILDSNDHNRWSRIGSCFGLSLRVQHLLARLGLGVLEDMGLAWSSGKGAWSVRRRSGECPSSNAARGGPPENIESSRCRCFR
jgi:hypothetical protein